MPLIRDGATEDLALMADILSDSFANDPIMNWVIPMPELYGEFFELIIEGLYLPRGITHVEDQGRGASLWLPPGEEFVMPLRLRLLGMIARLLVNKGFGSLKNIRQQGDYFARYHPDKPHYYLQFIGARRKNQGQGVGSALLKQVTRLCDEAQMPAYLESSNRLNVPLYQRHGFDIIHEGDIPGGGPTAWFMWRDPQQGQVSVG